MDHPAGPCYCWYRSREWGWGGGGRGRGEEREKMLAHDEHDEREDKGTRKCRWKRGAQNEGQK